MEDWKNVIPLLSLEMKPGDWAAHGRYREVAKGDLIHCGLGSAGAHQFYNHGDVPCVFFALSNRDTLDICEYPDSSKILVKKLQRVMDKDGDAEYAKGEENPRRYWPAKIVGGN